MTLAAAAFTRGGVGRGKTTTSVKGLAFVSTLDPGADPKVPEIAVYSKLQGIHWQSRVADDLRGLLHPAPMLYK